MSVTLLVTAHMTGPMTAHMTAHMISHMTAQMTVRMTAHMIVACSLKRDCMLLLYRVLANAQIQNALDGTVSLEMYKLPANIEAELHTALSSVSATTGCSKHN